ncbi:MAG TPA: hypothetical protein VEJ84_00880 [Acidimicrobiales bacterium]|nr:hypothetical protein [Acidimicrobiales bacterium]
MNTSRRRIGIDFDNTIIDYDDVFQHVAKQWGLVDESFQGSKVAVREEVRRLGDGELRWMKLQGYVYGKGIGGARLFVGVDGFLERCRREEDEVLIVSHKTEYGHFDLDRVNLRQAAREWMTDHRFFQADGYAISPGNVFFEGTRKEKLERIRQLACDVFIDDLEEVFLEPDFPASVKRILLSSQVDARIRRPVIVCSTWSAVEEELFQSGERPWPGSGE